MLVLIKKFMYKIEVANLITRLQNASNSIGNRVENNDWYDFITSAIRDLRSGRTLPWSKVDSQISLYTDIVKNSLPSDFDSFIKPSKNILSSGSNSIKVDGNYSNEKEFRNASEVLFGLMYNRDGKYLLSRYKGEEDLLIDNFGTEDYTLSGDASNEELDLSDYILGGNSLVFDITDSSHSFAIEKTIDSTNISNFVREGIATLFVKMPVALESLTLKIGNDSSNYYQITVTSQFASEAFQVGWNTIQFELNNASEVGSVNPASVSWYEISGGNTSITANNFKLNGLFLRLPSILDLPYNSKNTVETSDNSGTYQEKVSDGVNQILWEENFEDLLLYKTLEKAGFFKFRDIDLVQQSQSEYSILLNKFNVRYPSNEEKIKSRYYKQASRF